MDCQPTVLNQACASLPKDVFHHVLGYALNHICLTCLAPKGTCHCARLGMDPYAEMVSLGMMCTHCDPSSVEVKNTMSGASGCLRCSRVFWSTRCFQCVGIAGQTKLHLEDFLDARCSHVECLEHEKIYKPSRCLICNDWLIPTGGGHYIHPKCGFQRVV